MPYAEKIAISYNVRENRKSYYVLMRNIAKQVDKTYDGTST
jgi:hypothetical protein